MSLMNGLARPALRQSYQEQSVRGNQTQLRMLSLDLHEDSQVRTAPFVACILQAPGALCHAKPGSHISVNHTQLRTLSIAL